MIMDKIKINQKLHELALREPDSSIEKAISIEATETIDPAGHLKEMYGNKGLLYDMDELFFIEHIEEIVAVIQDHGHSVELEITIQDYASKLSFIAYQLTLQNMMVSFGMLTEEQLIY